MGLSYTKNAIGECEEGDPKDEEFHESLDILQALSNEHDQLAIFTNYSEIKEYTYHHLQSNNEYENS